MVLLLGKKDLQFLLLCLPAEGGILLLFFPSLKLSQLWDGGGWGGGVLRGFLTSSLLIRDSPAAVEQLRSSGGCSVLVEQQVSAIPIPEHGVLSFLLLLQGRAPGCVPQNGASLACPPSRAHLRSL